MERRFLSNKNFAVATMMMSPCTTFLYEDLRKMAQFMQFYDQKKFTVYTDLYANYNVALKIKYYCVTSEV